MKRLDTRFLGLVAIFVLAFAGIALAQAAPATAASATDGHWWKGILQGILGGILASLVGYAKNKDTRTGEHQEFGVKYLIQTCIFGAILGLVAGIMKKNPTDMLTSFETSPIFAGLTMAFEAGMKALWRNGVVHVRAMIQDAKTGNPTPPAPPKP